MATQEHLSYLKVKKLVITDLKSEAKIGSTQSKS